MLIDLVSVALRALSFVALFQAAGMAIFIAIFCRDIATCQITLRRIGWITACIGTVFVSAHYSLEAARMAGELSGMGDTSLQSVVLHSEISVAWGLRVTGLLLIAIGLTRQTVLGTALSLLGVALSVIAFTLLGHTAVHSDRVWLVVLLLVHLLVVAFWFGALVPLYVISLKESPLVASRIVDSFSKLAAWLVPCIFVAGLLMTWKLVAHWSVFTEPYGVALILKATSFGILMGLATLNKWRFGPAMASDMRAAVSLRCAIRIEYGLIVIVLAVTAVMTTLFSPEQ